MTITWNTDADYKLITSLAASVGSSLQWDKVAELMGDGCTVSALKHRITRLKEKVKLDGNTDKASGSTSKVSKTKPPRKRASKKAEKEKSPEESECDLNDITDGEGLSSA
ncbi:uncharacterized protein N7498_003157 [Penicillium cinerascens]|uniref:Myb-like domain-containing protein n=1 Tax=Penicillium cinerascens TaxID=70096 RepID=A0A9W9N1N0_9EURO|nr:uncharacterized protein N7498_003157 [Penicillium cinerascens]KAJ5211511.1 hypothetical protein N7498_003157 [Penicillium cinerascens]